MCWSFQAELYVNLLDDDIEEFSHGKLDDSNVDQFIDNIHNGPNDSAEEDIVDSVNSNAINKTCNKNIAQNIELLDIQNNKSKIHTSLAKHYLNNKHDIEDELNDDLVAKLLDPFEQLEREFNWDNVAAIKPPSAFSSGQPHHKSMDVETHVSKGLRMITKEKCPVDRYSETRRKDNPSNGGSSHLLNNISSKRR